MSKNPPILQWTTVNPDLVNTPPSYGSAGAIGLDLRCATTWSMTLVPGRVLVVPTNIAVAIPHGFYGRIAPRSGLAANEGVDVLAGVIDEDYRGEIKVLLTTNMESGTIISPDEKIAQLILERAERAELRYVLGVGALGETARGDRGFGSTG